MKKENSTNNTSSTRKSKKGLSAVVRWFWYIFIAGVVGVILLFVPFGNAFTLSGFALIGLGCAPVFPSLIHATPHHFGANKSQAVIGVQMASAYIGTCSLPPLFGFIANRFGISLLPVYVLFFCVLMIASHERLIRLTERRPESIV